MSKLTITTLTPLHIGSGTDFQGNFEYLYFKEQGVAVVIDQEKTLGVLGEEKITNWITCIEKREDLLALLKTRKANLRPEDIALRRIPVVHKGLSGKNALREQLHDGMGKPILPGSSLKGAIRTAIFAQFIYKNTHLLNNRANLQNRRGKFDDRELIKRCFGKDPNHDILRLLQVGDAFFEGTQCYSSNIVNQSGEKWITGSRTPGKDPMQFLEAIPAGSCNTGYVDFRIDDALFQMAEKKDVFTGDISIVQFHRLFPLLNDHIKDIVEREIKYWEDEGNPEAIGDYMEELGKILEVIEACDEKSCVIRLGWGTGYRTMTGAWDRKLPDDIYYDLVKSLRPKHPEELVYPKTTRMLEGGVPLGFIKLSI
ncbi:MAG: type III-A CRISPR-associated RAMP protein Csm5 [Saprospiraceae bacterium]|nr:type III-A CRISPR-associated RAMP protein Csm5 [Saprospiraceae bacterium]